MIDKALADVMDENIAAEELVVTEPLDGVIEEPATELAENVGDGCVTEGWLAEGCRALGSGSSGPSSSVV